MKKEYINPQMDVLNIKVNYNLLSGSGGLDGGTPGNSFTSTDVTYSSEFQDNGGSEDW